MQEKKPDFAKYSRRGTDFLNALAAEGYDPKEVYVILQLAQFNANMTMIELAHARGVKL